jgi:hypothetical protein
MSTFKRCPDEVNQMANQILCEFDTHRPLLDARVTVDYVFAFADIDEQTQEPVGNALSKNGVRALGLCRKIALKDRALGRADAEISIDGQWWEDATDAERRALLDHELHHIAVKTDKRGLVRDDLGRPVIQLRKHDYEFGWFKVIAARHGRASQERQQAGEMMLDAGQYFWPHIAPPKLVESPAAANA